MSGAGENGIDVRGHEARQIVERAIQRQHFAEPGPADRQIPSLAALRSKDAELPLLETRPPAADRRLDRGVQARARPRVRHLGAHDADWHALTLRIAGARRKVSR